MEKLYLVTNPGSSSRKYALYRDDELICSLHFEVEDGKVVCTLKQANGSRKKIEDGFERLTDTAKYARDLLDQEGYLGDSIKISAILARVASTGDYFAEDHIVTPEYLEKLEDAKLKAPLHVPVVAAEINKCVKIFAGTPIVSISDSAFHRTRDDVHRYYAIDTELADRAEIKRYGYHGLSMDSVAAYLKSADLVAEKIVACHIGSGSSLTALKNAESYDTTMGFTPLEGVMMATRCGDIDPAAALAIGNTLKLEGAKLEEYLNKQCGLKGVTGATDDMREVLSLRADGDPRAKLAYEMYIYRIQRAIGQMAASLQGIDALVFTATIGERNAEIRRDIVAGLAYLGFKINDTKNDDGLGDSRHCVISANTSKPIYVIATDETAAMIRRAQLLLS